MSETNYVVINRGWIREATRLHAKYYACVPPMRERYANLDIVASNMTREEAEAMCILLNGRSYEWGS